MFCTFTLALSEVCVQCQMWLFFVVPRLRAFSVRCPVFYFYYYYHYHHHHLSHLCRVYYCYCYYYYYYYYYCCYGARSMARMQDNFAFEKNSPEVSFVSSTGHDREEKDMVIPPPICP